MEQVVIFLIAAIFVGLRALVEKLKGMDKDNAAPAPPPARSIGSAPPQLTEADRRYREVQEEIRRRIAQRRQSQPPLPTPAASPRAASPALASPARTTAPAMPVPVSASTTEAAATEAAAYALPAPMAADAPVKSAAPAPAGSLRALLASQGAARQAYLLREVLDRPLALRAAGRGGHESWS